MKKRGLVATQAPRSNPAGLDVEEVADMNTSATDLDDISDDVGYDEEKENHCVEKEHHSLDLCS